MTPDERQKLREIAERANLPLRAEIYGSDEGIYLVWINPFTQKSERIATFWWPEHPPTVDATKQVEEWFESIAIFAATGPEKMVELFDQLDTLEAAVAAKDEALRAIEKRECCSDPTCDDCGRIVAKALTPNAGAELLSELRRLREQLDVMVCHAYDLAPDHSCVTCEESQRLLASLKSGERE